MSDSESWDSDSSDDGGQLDRAALDGRIRRAASEAQAQR
eukprot:COSAG06_NODE_6159_length_3076_cov_9.513432_2_plen_39_part_00